MLQELDMSGCANLTDESVEGLLQACPLLKILLFARCPKITGKVVLTWVSYIYVYNVVLATVTRINSISGEHLQLAMVPLCCMLNTKFMDIDNSTLA